MPENTIRLYSDGESFIYSPQEIDGFLLLNYNKIYNQIYYKFFNEQPGENVIHIKENKQYAMSLYNLFHKFITEKGVVDVLGLEDFDDEMGEIDLDSESDTTEIEDFFGFQYYEDTDVQIVKPLIDFYID